MEKPLPGPDQRQKTQLIILIVAISLFALALYFNFILLPQIGRVTHAVSIAHKTRSDLKNVQLDIGRMDEFNREIDTYQEKVNQYEMMLPAEKEIPALLENLSDMARNSSVKIVGITPSVMVVEEGEGQAYQEIPILVNAKCGYHELGKFLSNLENADRFMKIADIGIKSNKITPNRHDVELLVLTYTLVRNR